VKFQRLGPRRSRSSPRGFEGLENDTVRTRRGTDHLEPGVEQCVERLLEVGVFEKETRSIAASVDPITARMKHNSRPNSRRRTYMQRFDPGCCRLIFMFTVEFFRSSIAASVATIHVAALIQRVTEHPAAHPPGTPQPRTPRGTPRLEDLAAHPTGTYPQPGTPRGTPTWNTSRHTPPGTPRGTPTRYTSA